MIFGRLKKPDPDAEKKLREEIEKNGGVEKSDIPAMIISAFLVILPVVAILLGVMALFAWLFTR